MNNVNTIINITPFNNKYHNKIKNKKNWRYIFISLIMRFKNINGTLARDDARNAFKNDLNVIIWRYSDV